jgi:hypothetical protein
MARAGWLLTGFGTLLLLVAGGWWLAQPEVAAPGGLVRERAAAGGDAAGVPGGQALLGARDAGAVAALLPGGDLPELDSSSAPAAEQTQARAGKPATLHGIVIGQDGRPLAHAVVWYLPNITTLKAWGIGIESMGSVLRDVPLDTVPHVSTGADGRFAIESTFVPAPASRTGSRRRRWRSSSQRIRRRCCQTSCSLRPAR